MFLVEQLHVLLLLCLVLLHNCHMKVVTDML